MMHKIINESRSHLDETKWTDSPINYINASHLELVLAYLCVILACEVNPMYKVRSNFIKLLFSMIAHTKCLCYLLYLIENVQI